MRLLLVLALAAFAGDSSRRMLLAGLVDGPNASGFSRSEAQRLKARGWESGASKEDMALSRCANDVLQLHDLAARASKGFLDSHLRFALDMCGEGDNKELLERARKTYGITATPED